jgi:hypothetical protein
VKERRPVAEFRTPSSAPRTALRIGLPLARCDAPRPRRAVGRRLAYPELDRASWRPPRRGRRARPAIATRKASAARGRPLPLPSSSFAPSPPVRGVRGTTQAPNVPASSWRYAAGAIQPAYFVAPRAGAPAEHALPSAPRVRVPAGTRRRRRGERSRYRSRRGARVLKRVRSLRFQMIAEVPKRARRFQAESAGHAPMRLPREERHVNLGVSLHVTGDAGAAHQLTVGAAGRGAIAGAPRPGAIGRGSAPRTPAGAPAPPSPLNRGSARGPLRGPRTSALPREGSKLAAAHFPRTSAHFAHFMTRLLATTGESRGSRRPAVLSAA